MRRFAALVAVCSIAIAATAKPPYWEVYKNHYKIAGGSDAGKATCNVCHTSPPRRNAFGRNVDNALKQRRTGDLTPAILLLTEKEDPDKDGFTNLQEARAGTLPADPKSKPAGRPGRVSMDREPLETILLPQPSNLLFPDMLRTLRAWSTRHDQWLR